MSNMKYLRLWGFLIDYFIWYLIMVVMILISFLFIHQEIAFAGNLSAYQIIFNRIMHEPGFIIVYILILMIYEIVVPVITKGQTLSKKILHIKVEKASKINLCLRGLLKILMINPCGIIAFTAGVFFGQEKVNMISNVLSMILMVNMLSYIMNKKCLHSKISKTTIVVA